MHYLLAAVGAATIAVLLWRTIGAERVGVSSRRTQLAPDDDPEFLRELGEQQRRNRDPEESD